MVGIYTKNMQDKIDHCHSLCHIILHYVHIINIYKKHIHFTSSQYNFLHWNSSYVVQSIKTITYGISYNEAFVRYSAHGKYTLKKG